MINTLPQSLIESAKKILTESTISKHGELLSQWISSNDKFRDDPDDKSLSPESALSGMESRIQEYAHNYPQYDVSNKDYELRHVPINSIVSKHQSELSKESADITAEQIRNSKSYKDLYRKHDVMPILLGHDMSVLDGHHRLDAAKTNGEKTIPALAPVSKGSGKVLNVAKPQINESEEPNEVEQFRQKWKNAGVDNFVYGHEGMDTIGLSSVIVPKHAQNQGHGTKYMQDLSNLADKLGKTVTLTPSSDFGGTKTRLVKFYKSHGYVENKGRNKDFTISETMYRRPQEYRGQAPHQPEPISVPTEKPLAPIKDTVMSKHMKSTEFHKWFEGSKVKNGMGDPVIAYHGSPDMGKIEEAGAFRHKDDGIFFTNDMKTAQSYTDEKRSTNYQEAKGGVIPAHLNIKNPYYHDHQGKEWFGTGKIIADAKEKGHDGVIINNVVDHYNTNRVKKVRPSTVYVVFNPKQIKHATKNNGKHSPETENIFE